jgi:hypothetical protein
MNRLTYLTQIVPSTDAGVDPVFVYGLMIAILLLGVALGAIWMLATGRMSGTQADTAITTQMLFALMQGGFRNVADRAGDMLPDGVRQRGYDLAQGVESFTDSTRWKWDDGAQMMIEYALDPRDIEAKNVELAEKVKELEAQIKALQPTVANTEKAQAG